ncbi:hypothetical protein COO59_03865 [Mixta theicola]|uniref:Uncharacterized protein n=1 Tax=Mixta theicola TaxID=1458355 RepID=A0A2K1QDF9_9GAMM|nr:hypothetical protein [Mixta theicola]PNS13060.1 hypothetical protein COO59_03865 [Mixta theicola]GLR09322.1 hypothetical protein GCM10007905_20420 [Mixta theicola]
MKKRLAIVLLMASCGVAQAATEASSEAESYIAGLCTITGEQRAVGESQEEYVQKLKDMISRGSAPSAVNKPEFNQDEAEKVADAYMKLPDEVKKNNLNNADACKKATLEQYQKAE